MHSKYARVGVIQYRIQYRSDIAHGVKIKREIRKMKKNPKEIIETRLTARNSCLK